LGCDRLGRDHFALLTYGILLTSLISFPARLVTLVFAFGISLLASYLPKFFKDMFDSISAVFLSIPSLLVALIIVSIFQGSYFSFLLSITISDWASSYETIQVKIKEIQESNFVQISKNLGAGNFYIFQRHIFPEIKELLINLFLTGIPAVIMTVSIFSYMGVDFGTDTFGPGLGEQISFSKDFAHVSPLSVIIPILGIILLVLSVHVAARRSINDPS
jgi:peptide/nickel transport system permease protein